MQQDLGHALFEEAKVGEAYLHVVTYQQHMLKNREKTAFGGRVLDHVVEVFETGAWVIPDTGDVLHLRVHLFEVVVRVILKDQDLFHELVGVELGLGLDHCAKFELERLNNRKKKRKKK